jgi:Na+-driven multidrug efflux pump
LWKEITGLNPSNEKQQLIQQQMLTEICAMTQNHRTRVINSTRGVAPIMWVALIVGGIFTTVFTYFFGIADLRVQAIMTMLVSIVLSLNLCLVFIFGNPMLTDLGVKPGPFQLDLVIFENFERGDMPEAHPIHN